VTDLLHSPPTVGARSLRALGRYPSRTAFSWPGGSITYRGATEQIGRMQRVLLNAGTGPGARVALLSANRADAWCVGVAAQLSRLATTWLHPLASLDDKIDQIEDCEAEILVIDADAFRLRGGDLAARAAGVRHVFTLGRAEYGVDLLSASETVGSAVPKDLAGPDDVAALSYTGGTTGKSKGALRRHRELSGFASAVSSNFEIPDNPRFLAVAPISHVAGTKVLPTLMRGGTALGMPVRTSVLIASCDCPRIDWYCLGGAGPVIRRRGRDGGGPGGDLRRVCGAGKAVQGVDQAYLPNLIVRPARDLPAAVGRRLRLISRG